MALDLLIGEKKPKRCLFQLMLYVPVKIISIVSRHISWDEPVLRIEDKVFC